MHTEGRGTIEECEIFADTRVGVAIWENGDAVVRRSKIHENKDAGVMIFQSGHGTVHDCEFWGHNGRNLDIRKGCELMHRAIAER